MTRTSVDHNIPTTLYENLFAEDPLGEKLFAYWLGTAFPHVRGHFETMGASGAAATPFSQEADRLSPKLVPPQSKSDPYKIDFHESYEELKKLSYGKNIIGLKFDPQFLARHKAIRHTAGFGAGYYFAQTETGLYCPICMTDALARVLEMHGRDEMTQTTLAHLTTSNLKDLWEGAMFLTEREGGSDVGVNSVQAEKIENKWFLSGHKWFCSNAGAKAILALARMPGADGAPDKGTRGLGLFLILPDINPDIRKTMEYHKLKDKLGVRSMASAEITLHQTPAFLLGGAGEGFKMMADMVNMSRLYNAVASIGVAKRAILEACAYGTFRKAFGKTLRNTPLWRSEMADLIAEHLGLMFLVFESSRTLDKSDLRDAEASSLVRILTPLAKGSSAKFAVWACSESMELVGGNGYIEEDTVMPRLLRDAQVLPIWEGTTNIQSLDVLRAAAKEGVGAFEKRIAIALQKAGAAVSPELMSSLKAHIGAFQKEIAHFGSASPETKERMARVLLEKMSRIFSMCMMAESCTDSGLQDVCQAALNRLLKRPAPTSPLGMLVDSDSIQGEDVLLNSIFAQKP
ncbi:MAG: acyl-CoA dehydrogenase family protein [Pseudobdellovibrionaceae bacterium]